MTGRVPPSGPRWRFRATRSASAGLRLAAVLEFLRSQQEVVAVVLLGSTVHGLQDWSDIDLLVVLKEGPKFDSEFATIEGRSADILFTNVDAVRKIADSQAELAGRLADLSLWTGGGRLGFRRSADVDRAFEVAHGRCSRRASDRERFFRWVELNVNLVKLERYLAAGTSDHLAAAHLMLDRAFAALPQDALALAGIGWTGEREALAELRRSGGPILRAIEAGRVEQDPIRRLEVYRSAAALAAEPAGGLWPAEEAAGGWVLSGSGTVVNSRWEELLA